MNTDEALKLIADRIWTKGEVAEGCLIPTEYAFGQPDEFNQASDILFAEYQATHFSRKWQEKGTWVEIILFKGDAFGACLNLELATEPFYVPV